MNNNDFKFIHLNSKHYDEYVEKGVNSEMTFYMKNPIILEEEYDVKVVNFSLKKTINSSILVYDSGLSTVDNASATREILPEFYNTNVI